MSRLTNGQIASQIAALEMRIAADEACGNGRAAERRRRKCAAYRQELEERVARGESPGACDVQRVRHGE